MSENNTALATDASKFTAVTEVSEGENTASAGNRLWFRCVGMYRTSLLKLALATALVIQCMDFTAQGTVLPCLCPLLLPLPSLPSFHLPLCLPLSVFLS